MKSRMRSHSKSRLAIEFVDRRLVGRSVGEQPHEPDRGRLDEMDAGRFQRLEEAGGKAERDAIAVPHLAPLAAREAKPVRVARAARRRGSRAAASRQRRRRCACSNRRGRCRCGAGAECATASPARARSRACRGRAARCARRARPSRGRTAASGSSPRSRSSASARSAARGSPSNR